MVQCHIVVVTVLLKSLYHTLNLQSTTEHLEESVLTSTEFSLCSPCSMTLNTQESVPEVQLPPSGNLQFSRTSGPNYHWQSHHHRLKYFNLYFKSKYQINPGKLSSTPLILPSGSLTPFMLRLLSLSFYIIE